MKKVPFFKNEGVWNLNGIEGLTPGSCLRLIDGVYVSILPINEKLDKRVKITSVLYSDFYDASGDRYESIQALKNATDSFFVNAPVIGSGGLKFYNEATGLYFRVIVRNGTIAQDKELTTTGFSGVENTDWENIGGSL